MAFKIVRDEDELLEVMLEDEDLGLGNLIVKKLLEQKSVKFAACKYEHPLKMNPVIRVMSKEPRKALKKAIEDAKDEVEDFKERFTAPLKGYKR